MERIPIIVFLDVTDHCCTAQATATTATARTVADLVGVLSSVRPAPPKFWAEP